MVTIMKNINDLVKEELDPFDTNRKKRQKVGGLPPSAMGIYRMQGGVSKILGRPGLGYDPEKDIEDSEKERLAKDFNKKVGEKIL